MGTILNGKYLSMPEQVQKNKNDIQIITEYLENIYKCSTALEESSTSINIEYTNIGDKRDFLFAFLLDNKGLLFKIIDIVGDIVYLEFYSKLPSVDFNYLGEWVAGNNEYHPNDVVLYNGSLYICENTILDSSVAPPQDTTNWSLFLGFGEEIGNFIENLYERNQNEGGLQTETTLNNGLLKTEILWRNTSPENDFTSQSITLSRGFENFTYLLIVFKLNKTYNTGFMSKIVNKTYWTDNLQLLGFFNQMYYRNFSITSGNQTERKTISFDSAKRISDSGISNDVLIPVEVYGFNKI